MLTNPKNYPGRGCASSDSEVHPEVSDLVTTVQGNTDGKIAMPSNETLTKSTAFVTQPLCRSNLYVGLFSVIGQARID